MRKLIKHELKNYWFMMMIINVAILAVWIFASIFVLIFNNSMYTATAFGIFSIIMIAYVIFGIYVAAIVFLIINIVNSLSTKLFSNEGYLTFSIPVDTDSIIISKLITNFIWIVGTMIVSLIGIFIFILCIEVILNQSIYIFKELTNIFIDNAFETYITILKVLFGILFIIIVLLFMNSLLNIGKFNRGKGGMLVLFIVSFLVLYFFLKNITSYISFGVGFSSDGYGFYFGKAQSIWEYNSSKLVEYYVIDITSIILHIGYTVGLYFLSRHFIKNKLELE